MTITPIGFGVPLSGPSPSMPTMPSTIARSGVRVMAMSTMLLSMPRQCNSFFGQP